MLLKMFTGNVRLQK